MALVDKKKFHVNMDWESSTFLTKNKGEEFLVACKDFETTIDRYDKLTVMFTPRVAFLFVCDRGTANEDPYSGSDIKTWLKTNFDASFPEMYTEYIPLVDVYGVNTANLEEFGLSAYADEFCDRIEDLEWYGRDIEKGV